ncbi:partner and localizer of BRCA2 isoform X2 [Ascaphus truei]
MEDPLGKSLTLEEKEKLKEKLALLKKEYKRTFNRLQRSQRAERVKTHVKKTIEEQNRLLSQEVTELLAAEPLNKVHDSPGNVSTSRESQSSFRSTERKPSVTFNLEPEIFRAGGISGSAQETALTPRGEGTRQDIGEQGQRSRLKLNRATKRDRTSGRSPPDTSLLRNTLNEPEGQRDKALAINDSGSPVFKKSGQSLSPEVKCHNTHGPAGAVRLQIPGSSAESRKPADNSTEQGTRPGACVLITGYNYPRNLKRGSDNLELSPPLFTKVQSSSAKEAVENDVGISGNRVRGQSEALISADKSPGIEVTERTICDNSCNFIVTPQLENRETAHVPQLENRETTHVPQLENRETTHVPQLENRETTHVPQLENRETALVPHLENRETTHAPQLEHCKTTHAPQLENRETIHVPQLENRETAHVPQLENRETIHVTQLENRETIHVTQLENRETIHVTQLENRETIHVPQLENREITHVPQLENRETAHVPQLENRETIHVPQLENRETTPVLQLENRETAHVPQLENRETTPVPQPEHHETTHTYPHGCFPICTEEQPLQKSNKFQGESTSTEEENNPLGSYTLVEGLLFPVEYYVRTTRRMSSCQRKVDLEAVIHSHLGTGRRGARGKQKLKTKDKVNWESSSVRLSPSPRVCLASDGCSRKSTSSALSVTPLSHSTSSIGTSGAFRCRRGKGKHFNPTVNMLLVSTSPGLKEISIPLECDGVSSLITGGSQSEKENCEEEPEARMGQQSGLVCTNRAEKSRITEELHSGGGSILFHCNNTLANNLEHFERDPIIHRTSRQASECAVGLQSSQPHCVISDVCSSQGFQTNSCLHHRTGRSKDKRSPRTRGESSAGDVCLAAGSPFYDLSGRLSLKQLACSLDIRDFHLPDEEFGVLKLEKLKYGCHLEPFVLKPSTEKKGGSASCRRHYNRRAPSTDSPTIIQAAEKCSDRVERDSLPLKSSEHQLTDVQPAAREQSTVRSQSQVSIVSQEHEPVSSRGSPTGELSSAVNQEPIAHPAQSEELLLMFDEAKEERKQASISSRGCKKELFPLGPPREGKCWDCSSRSAVNEKHSTNDPVPRIVSQMPIRPSAWDKLHPPSASSSPTKRLKPSALSQSENELNLDILQLNPSIHSPLEMQSVGATASHTEIRAPASHPSPRELSCGVLFSTSMCTVPPETISQQEVAPTNPAIPFLGLTPAAFSPPYCNASHLTPCRSTLWAQTILSREPSGQNKPAEVSGDEFLPLTNDERNFTQSKSHDNQRHGIVPQPGTAPVERENTEAVGQCEVLRGKISVQMESCDSDSQAVTCGQRRGDMDVVTQEGGRLHLVSQIQNGCVGVCAVDLCSAWWEFSDSTDLCIVAASESSVSLWRPRAAGHWEAVHTWNFIEVPVIQILPLSGEKNMVCVALGNLEIGEI